MMLQVFTIKKCLRQTSNDVFLELITIDSVNKKDENYYLQVILKECNFIEKKSLDILLMT